MSEVLIQIQWESVQGGSAIAAPERHLTPAVRRQIAAIEDICLEVEGDITTPEESALVDAALAQIKSYKKQVAVDHEIQKAPFLSAGRSCDAAKNLALSKVEPLELSLEAKQRKFKAIQLQRQREAEERQRQEAEKIKREQEAAAEEARQAKARAGAEAKRIADEEARLRRERDRAEAERVADQAKLEKEAREAREEQERQRIARESELAEIARREAWDNSLEGKAEAERQRQEIARQQQEAAETARMEADRLERDRLIEQTRRIEEQQRIAREEEALEVQRLKNAGEERKRQEEAALNQAVIQDRIEQVTAPRESGGGKIATRWTFMLVGTGDDEIKRNLIACAVDYPELFTIEVNTSAVSKLAKQIKGGAHPYGCFRFFEQIK